MVRGTLTGPHIPEGAGDMQDTNRGEQRLVSKKTPLQVWCWQRVALDHPGSTGSQTR